MANGNGNGNGQSWVWPSIIAGGTALIQAFWILAYGSISAELTRLQKEIDKQYHRAEEVYTKKENTEQYRQRIAVEIKALQNDVDKHVISVKDESKRMVEQVRRLRDDSVSRDSYAGRHEAIIDDVKRANVRIDELRRDFGASYTLSDKIKELQDQIKLLQAQGYTSKKVLDKEVGR